MIKISPPCVILSGAKDRSRRSLRSFAVFAAQDDATARIRIMPAKILIVEDDAVARTVLVSALKPDKYEVAVSPDALSALSLARKLKPDLILLDLGLPAGGGYTFLQRMKQLPELSIIPVIVVSGYDATTHEPRTAAAGVSVYLQKPVKPEDVRDAVRRLLGEQDVFAPKSE